ncbi:MAG: spermidine/putrescine import ABC transporter permease protein PotB [Pseudolabrys sp.]|nr:spermidine/putrescine import ABC transporter permease protein PotB [Pseudolabrys sp.]
MSTAATDLGPSDSIAVKKAGGIGRSARWTLFALLAPGTAWLLVFIAVPLGFTLAMSVWKSTILGTVPAFQFGNYIEALTTPLYRDLLFKTVRIGVVTTVLSLLTSYPIAYCLAMQSGQRKAVLLLLLFLPFWTSYVVRTFVWLPILGRTGAVNQFLMTLGIIHEPLPWLLYNEGAIYLGLVYVYTLFMTLPIYLAIEKIDPRLIEAAADLGAKPRWVFLRIILPLSWPGVLSGSLMVFLLAVSAYVTPQLLGGPSGIMFSNMIADQFLSNNNWAFGAALSIVLSAVVLLILIVAGRWVGVHQVFAGGRT